MDVNDISKFKQLFVDEATGLLNSMEGIILELENNPENQELIQEVFRVMHTIKGVSGMYGFDAMSELTHNIENIYDLLRNKLITLEKDILNLTLEAVDQLFSLMADEKFTDPKNIKKQDDLLAWCKRILLSPQNKVGEQERGAIKPKSQLRTFNIVLHTPQSIVDRRINLLYTIKDLSEVGEIRSINPLPTEADSDERWSIFVVGNCSDEDMEDALMFVYEYCIIRKVADYDIFDVEQLNNFRDTLLEKEEAHQSYKTEKEFDSNSLPDKSKVVSSDATINSIRKNMNRVAVDAEKLDHLMYLVSELITTTSQLNLSSSSNNMNRVKTHVERLDKLSKQFRNNALDIRLIPIKDIVPKFTRLIRDVSHGLGKDVSFVTKGVETELDKSSIDMVAEPLVHILRNALDHGIEMPDERAEEGKESQGIIELNAYNLGTNVIIEVKDDGRGLNKEKILQKALAQDLIKKEDSLSDEEIYKLICLPGFSTASEVTEISGRGVGMDVVSKKIADLRGELIIDSKTGKGTKITIKLQQSISILDTLHIKTDHVNHLIPLSDVEICTQIGTQEIKKRLRHGTLEYEKELVPFISLRNYFDLANSVKEMEKVVIIRRNESRMAFVADEIIGQHQAVLKPMGDLMSDQKELSAASILGNGEVAFLLDSFAFS